MKSFIILVLSFCAFNARALTADQVAAEFNTTLEPFYATGNAAAFTGVNGVHINGRYFVHPSPSQGTIVISNGLGETFHKYIEVAYDLYSQGYSVFLYDHRGQGTSDHLLPDPHAAYIDQFEYMIQDLKTFVDGTVKVEAEGPYYLLAHSMGGMVSARYLEEYPRDFSAAVLSGAMLRINLPSWGIDPAKWILDAASFLGQDKFYVAGPQNPLLQTFAQQTVTHNPIRYAILNQGIRATNPQEMVWGETARWVDQSIHAGLGGIQDGALASATPILMFQAGQDTLVAPDGQNDFCAKAAKCHVLQFPTARHEILMENDDIRSSAMAQILQQFNHSAVNKDQVLF